MREPTLPQPVTEKKALIVEELKSVYEEIEARADTELKIIGTALRELVREILRERPDNVVFFDYSARVFATPILKYLGAQGVKDKPKFRFYESSHLSETYAFGGNVAEVAAQDLGQYLGEDKITFFVDETFSSGKIVAALWEAAKSLPLHFRYFALSMVSDPHDLAADSPEAAQGRFYDIPLAEHVERYNAVQADPRFSIYKNMVERQRKLFSFDTANFYVYQSVVKARKKLGLEKEETSEGDISQIKGDPPEKEILQMNFNFVNGIKEKIYHVLEEHES